MKFLRTLLLTLLVSVAAIGTSQTAEAAYLKGKNDRIGVSYEIARPLPTAPKLSVNGLLLTEVTGNTFNQAFAAFDRTGYVGLAIGYDAVTAGNFKAKALVGYTANASDLFTGLRKPEFGLGLSLSYKF